MARTRSSTRKWTNGMWMREAAERGLAAKQLTWERFDAGDACPGCGRPYRRELLPEVCLFEVECLERMLQGPLDGTAMSSSKTRGTPYPLRNQVLTVFTKGLATYDRATDLFTITPDGQRRLAIWREDNDWLEAHRATHEDIHSHSFNCSGGPIHCGLCCPPPPLSPGQIARIASIIRDARDRQARQSRLQHPRARCGSAPMAIPEVDNHTAGLDCQPFQGVWREAANIVWHCPHYHLNRAEARDCARTVWRRAESGYLR